MRISEVRVENYRSIRDCTLSLSQFVCVIGENNAGKSNFLLAVSLFLTGSKLQPDDYYDPSSSVRIEVVFEDVNSHDLSRIQDEHRPRIVEIITEGRLHLIRLWDTDGSSKLLCRRLVPAESRFQERTYSEGMKGKNGAELRTHLSELFPDYSDRFEGLSTQKAAKERLEEIIREFPLEQFELQDDDLPTGIPNSIKALLPEPIYVPAVKDVNDEVKMKESATLGKLIAIVLKQIEVAEELADIRSAFNNLNSLLNRIQLEDGSLQDNRLHQVRSIEEKIASYVQESFPKVVLELVVPPPELKQVFANAQMVLDDGVRNGIDSKGDGLKRSVVFALIRSYVDLRQVPVDGVTGTLDSSYIFLFEEPELFLHPTAQSILFDALGRLSSVHHVVTTTHSPAFFSPSSTSTFVKVSKIHPSIGKPYSHAVATDLLKDMSARDAFQIICYENNAAAFFAQRVVLVEGDSDFSYFKHTAHILNPDWDFTLRNIPIIRINGKGNVKKYREFYEKFGLEVHTIVDLDALLGDFDKLTSDEEIVRCRSRLFEIVDGVAEASATTARMTGERIKAMTVQKDSWRDRYDRLKYFARETSRGNYSVINDEACQEIESLFSWESADIRKQILFLGSHSVVQEAQGTLLDMLRNQNVYVLSQGTLEQYYPPGVIGADKPTKALHACSLVKSRDAIEQVCPTVVIDGESMLELETMFRRIFS